MSAGPSIKFTVFESVSRLSKRYSLASDGKSVIKESFTQLYEGGYRVATLPAGDIPAALQVCGTVFDALTYKQAITLGVPRDGSTAGLITTQGKVRDGTAPAVAIPRDLEHFGWPELALLFLDGDDRDGLYELLCGLYPALAKVAALVRPSVSACVSHPVTGKALKTGEHVYLVIDKPERSHDCHHAIIRLAWVHGQGAAAGWLALSIRGDVLIRGPIDAIVGSPERLSYEGAGKLEGGLKALPRDSRVTGGSAMVDADDLIAYADQHAPEQRFREMVDAAKNDPAFIAACAAVKADYRATHIKKGAAQRLKKDASLTPRRPRRRRRRASTRRKPPGLATPTGGSGFLWRTTMFCTFPTAKNSPSRTSRPTRRSTTTRSAAIRPRGWITNRAIVRLSTPTTTTKFRSTPGRTATRLLMSRRSTGHRGLCCLRASPACRPSTTSRRRRSRRTPSRWSSRNGIAARCATPRSGASGTCGTGSVGSRTASARFSTWRVRSVARPHWP